MDRIKKFFSLLASDFLKLSKMKSVYIGIAVMLFLTLLLAVAESALTSLLDSVPVEEGGVSSDAVSDAFTLTVVHGMLNGAPSSTGVFFLIPIIAALFIGNEFSTGMARLYIGRGVHKTDLYISKFIVISALSVIYVCLSFAMCAVAAEVSGLEKSALDGLHAYTPDAFGSYLFLAVTLSAIYTAVCFVVRSRAASMATLIAMLIVLGDVLVAVVQVALAMQPTGIDSTGKFVYMLLDPYYCIDALSYAHTITAREAGIAFGSMAGWTTLFFGGGLLLNEKRDVK